MRLSHRAWFLGAVGALAAGWLVMGMEHKATPKSSLPEVEADPRELYQVVQMQIRALRAKNFPAAYEFAASGIREKFPVDQFSQMIQQTYPRLMRPTNVSFGLSQFASDSQASAIIYLTNGEESSPMIYAFIKERGKWKIAGVQLLQIGNRSISVIDPET